MNRKKAATWVYKKFQCMIKKSSFIQSCPKRLIKNAEIPSIGFKCIMFENCEVGKDGSIHQDQYVYQIISNFPSKDLKA